MTGKSGETKGAATKGQTTQMLPRSPVGLLYPDKLYWGSVTTSPSNVLSPTLAPRSPADPIPQVPAMSIETTAYGLLHLLLWEGKAELADQAASWLSRQGSFQGGYRSTQVGAVLGF